MDRSPRGTRTARARHLLLGLVAAVMLATVALTLWLVALSWTDPVAARYYDRSSALANVVTWLGFTLAGGLLALRRPANAVGWLLAGAGASMLVLGFWLEYGLRALALAPGTLPVWTGAVLISHSLWGLPFAMIALLLLVFPDGRLVSPRWRWAAGVSAASGVVVLAAAVPAWPQRAQVGRTLAGGDELGGVAALVVLQVGLALLLVGLLAGVVALLVRFGRATGEERLQVRWLLLAGALFAVVSVPNTFAESQALEVVWLVSLLALPAAVLVAVLRYRLYEIDRVISRTATYAVVTAVLVGVYALVAVVPAAVFALDSDLLVAAATLVAAAAFGPVRRRVQSAVDRRFDRARYDAQQVVEAFGARLRDDADLADLARQVSGVVARTVQPRSVSVWLRDLGAGR